METGVKTRRNRPRQRFETRLLWIALLSGLPAVLVALWLLWTGDFTFKVPLTLTIVVLGIWIGGSLLLTERAVRPLQTISNLLAAISEGDTTMRGHVERTDDALGLAYREANRLVDMVREERLSAIEATALLRRILEAIDLAVLGFDGDRRLRLFNETAARLYGRPGAALIGKSAEELGLAVALESESPAVLELAFPTCLGRWEVRRSFFRERGLPHQLVILTDLSRTLREEERLAWRNLIRVLSHEINNSLAPIRSLAASLRDLLADHPLPEELDQDVAGGLTIITDRAASLGRFMQSYAQLARLPAPSFGEVDVAAWVARVVALETRLAVAVDPGPELSIEADAGQLDQLLINLLKNAVEASREGEVKIRWSTSDSRLLLRVEDDGLGVTETENLFVPFYTTKPGGTGIGLALSRQIAESHGGVLVLRNREPGPGCVAELRLPLNRGG